MRAIVLITVGATIAAGCSGVDHAQRVGDKGKVFAFPGGSLTFAPGAVPTGTAVEVHAATPSIPAHLNKLMTAAGKAIDVHVGRQPSQPVAVQFSVTPPPEGADQAGAVLLLSGTKSELLTARWNPSARYLTAEIPHFSFAIPVWLNPIELWNRLSDIARRIIDQSIGTRTPSPACAGKAASVGSTTVSFEGDPLKNEPPQWPCLETADSNNVRLVLTSNSGVPWLVRASKGAKPDPQGSTSLSGAALIALWQELAPHAPNGERLLPPGGTVSYQFPLTTLPALVQAKEDVGAYLAGISLFSAFYLADVLTGGDGSALPQGVEALLGAGSTLDCMAAVVDAAGELSGAPSVAAVTSIVQGVIQCASGIVKALGGALSGILSVVLSALGGGIALGLGGFKAVTDTAFKHNLVSIRLLTSSTSGTASKTSSPEAAAKCVFGAFLDRDRGSALACSIDQGVVDELFGTFQPNGVSLTDLRSWSLRGCVLSSGPTTLFRCTFVSPNAPSSTDIPPNLRQGQVTSFVWQISQNGQLYRYTGFEYD